MKFFSIAALIGAASASKTAFPLCDYKKVQFLGDQLSNTGYTIPVKYKAQLEEIHTKFQALNSGSESSADF